MTELEKKAYMQKAIDLAQQGEGFVNPNPLVGSIIVKDGKIIGEGYHEKYGGPHAEVNAFNHATEDVEGATMFVTLEPCAHYGKTPPCALKIVEKKIKKVIIAKTDPNPLVNMKGIEILKNAGIEVEYGLMSDQVELQNEIFLKYIQTKKPFVSIKYAMTADGKLATKNLDSKWITNEASRAYVHELRNKHMAILVGVNTIIHDDARLNTRLDKPHRNPIRIIIDPELTIPRDAYVIKTATVQPTWIVTKKYEQRLVDQGVRIIQMPEIDLAILMDKLGEEKVDSVLIEGGSYTHGKALESGIVDKVYVFIAPKLIGGTKALTPVGGEGVALMSDAYQLKNVNYTPFGDDILMEGTIIKGA
ncbi:MAG: bifunctional diaminohydroxyphosphoribosylaminopyrimidine deaminase/5-amino-6-(5-phosphoribosylamino)uracil reductase RibD [Acholeplasma sp.]|jgi:diaminohydroxyphosphoribosylaminopyrimidine deaminase/5-amino-6-(5-phosphoribosylamino)uracil reductase|nr:bifunctional diaminohydroxyphosphoribosylaminopyrimidine deaminase/5-amino-6-(5-phosphoribosylamino)uracil reductase RibD [Acholeplasma sp.]